MAGPRDDGGAPEVMRWLEAPGPPGQRVTRRFTLRAPPHVHSMDVSVRYDALGAMATFKLYVGGDGKRDCVEILAMRADEVAYLLEVRHHPDCAVGRDYARAGSLRMLRAAFECVRRLAPWVTAIHLRDETYAPCGATTVSLAPLHIFERGQTWYELHFGAHLGRSADGAQHLAYRRAVSELAGDAALKSAVSWYVFCDVYGADPDDEPLRRAYEPAATFGAFFQAVQDATAQHSHQAFCAAVAPWAERLVEAHTAMGPRLGSWIRQPWFVDLPREDVYEPDVSVQAPQAGGGATTRRRAYGSASAAVRVSQTDARAARDGARLQLTLEDAS